MKTLENALATLTAVDVMKGPVKVIPRGTPLRQIAHELRKEQIGAAPIVDEDGRCVGMISAIDFLRWAEEGGDSPPIPADPEIRTCSYQKSGIDANGRERTLCVLEGGACPLQTVQKTIQGEDARFCLLPHCFLIDWQQVTEEESLAMQMGRYMTCDVVTVEPDLTLPLIARMMVDAHIHHVIVIDEDRRPVGMISSTDLMAALARHACEN